MAEDLRWWHGGVSGLRSGDLLLPPQQSGAFTRMDMLVAALPPGWMEADRNRPDRVYLTRERELARAYAHGWGRRMGGHGALYIARPLGPVATDPDHPDHSIECERAEVVAVYDPVVVMRPSRYRRIMMAQVSA